MTIPGISELRPLGWFNWSSAMESSQVMKAEELENRINYGLANKCARHWQSKNYDILVHKLLSKISLLADTK